MSFTKRYHPPGTAPGTLVSHDGHEEEAMRMTLVDYSPASFTEQVIGDPAGCREFLDRDSVTWIHIQGRVDPDSLRALGAIFGLHPLALEDVINTGQRPKADSYDDQIFVTMNLPTLDGEGNLWIEQVSLFAGTGFLISFHHGDSHPFVPVLARLRKHGGRIRERGVDYLLYSLLDLIIDQGFPLLESLSEQLEAIEEALLDTPDKDTLARIHRIRRDLLLLRRMLWPQREVLNTLIREGHTQIQEATRPYLRDCYDHTVQIMDLIESYREMAASMLDVYLSSLSHRLNEVMRVLTVIATIFIPLTFIAGVYGMNFTGDSPWAMPELEGYYSYPILWLIMIGIALGMLGYFRRRGWF